MLKDDCTLAVPIPWAGGKGQEKSTPWLPHISPKAHQPRLVKLQPCRQAMPRSGRPATQGWGGQHLSVLQPEAPLILGLRVSPPVQGAECLLAAQPAASTSYERPPPALGTDTPVWARCPSHVSSTGQPPLFKGLGLSHLSSGRPHMCALVPLPSSSPSLLNECSRQLLPRPAPLQCLLPREPPGPPPGLLQPHIPFGVVTTSSWETALGKAGSLPGPKSLHQ